PWIVLHRDARALTDAALQQATSAKSDGAIAVLASPETAETLSRWRIPIVDLSPSARINGAMHVGVDVERVAVAVIDHFNERGFHRFACWDPAGASTSGP